MKDKATVPERLLETLRERIVALASYRFDKFYHNSTATHILRQLDGTELGAFPVKGYGDFADEAFEDYARNLKITVSQLDEKTLKEAEVRLTRFSPSANRKFELQIELPTSISQLLSESAKLHNTTVEAYVNRVILLSLPSQFDRKVVATWYKEVQEGKRRFRQSGFGGTKSFTLPVTAIDLERLIAVLPFTKYSGLSEIVHDIIIAKVAVPESAGASDAAATSHRWHA